MIKSQSRTNNSVLEVKSKYDAEFRRFGLNKQSLTRFDEFYSFLERLHGLFDIQFNICYVDKDGDLLPINNDCNYNHVLNFTVGILRLLIQRKGECYDYQQQQQQNQHQYSHGLSSSLNHKPSSSVNLIKNIKEFTSSNHHTQFSKPLISYPEDFRPVSAIIDVDILPETYRRVRLHKHKSSKPLGFYIRDGRSIRVTANGVEQVPSIFISRLMPGGLAESTGLLSVNDEVIEVNGIEVAGKTLDQVTDMMIANSSNLIITVKPANQRYNLDRSSHPNNRTIDGGGGGGGGSSNKTTPLIKQPLQPSSASSFQQQQQHHQQQSTTSSISSNSSSKRSSNTNLNRSNTANSVNKTKLNNNNDNSTLTPHHHPHNQHQLQHHHNNNHKGQTDDEDDDEIHDANNSNDDKVLTL